MRDVNENNGEKEMDAQEVVEDVIMEMEESSPATSVMYASLQRAPGEGMKPKSIIMGIYGPRGEKIRHTVHQGAMKLPSSAIEILKDVQQECIQQTHEPPTKSFELPAIDGVIRPTMDNASHRAVIITELSATERPIPQVHMTMDAHGHMVAIPPVPQEKWQTHARNWKLKLPSPQEDVAEERIRGGGDDVDGGGDDDVEMVDASSGDSTSNPAAETTTCNTGAEATENVATTATATDETPSEATSRAKVPVEDVLNPPGSATTASPDPNATPDNTMIDENQQAPATASSTDAAKPSDSSAPSTLIGQSIPSPEAEAPSAADTGAVPSDTAPAATESSEKAPPSNVASSDAPVVSSETTTTIVPKSNESAVKPLPSKPSPQWEQNMPPPNDEMQSEPKTPKPSWYSADKISDFERQMLPEWFDGSALHRTPDSYKQTRERIIEISDKLGQRYVTGTLVRRTIPGDAGSLLRLHSFLTSWCFINEDAINDSAPTPPGLREDLEAAGRYNKTNVVWNAQARDELLEAVVDLSNKRRKTEDGSSFVPIDWSLVSKRVANGASALECEKVFLALPLEAAAAKLEGERSITPDVTSSEKKEESNEMMDLRERIMKEIVDQAHPEVVKAATDAALAATDNVAEAQKAGLLAVVASEAAVRAKKEEETVSRLLAELQEQRLQKLENRLALLDDVEGILEAERVALELERRDLYTARCRHWFGGAS